MAVRRFPAVTFTGMQPTGRPHLGNYLAALRPFLTSTLLPVPRFFSIVDLHALTSHPDPKTLRESVKDLARVFVAMGIGVKEGTFLFRQSDVSEHAELSWVLGCFARVGRLSRMTQWKVCHKILRAITSIYRTNYEVKKWMKRQRQQLI